LREMTEVSEEPISKNKRYWKPKPWDTDYDVDDVSLFNPFLFTYI